MGVIIILSHVNPLKNAVAIIYAVLVSNEMMPNISQTKLSKITRVNQSTIAQLYNKYYKIFARKLDFDFQRAQLGRNVISLYFDFIRNAMVKFLFGEGTPYQYPSSTRCYVPYYGKDQVISFIQTIKPRIKNDISKLTT